MEKLFGGLRMAERIFRVLSEIEGFSGFLRKWMFYIKFGSPSRLFSKTLGSIRFTRNFCNRTWLRGRVARREDAFPPAQSGKNLRSDNFSARNGAASP